VCRSIVISPRQTLTLARAGSAGLAQTRHRARLHDAALRAEQGGPVDWAALAADLGYSDQAHLTRDFTATIGEPPARYAGG
jgi:AraC-like DNA-binding protein